jgi:hypothetical protein
MNGHVSEHNSSCKPLILYATETGTAQDAADCIARQCRRLHTQARVLNMATYSPVTLHLIPFSIFISQFSICLYSLSSYPSILSSSLFLLQAPELSRALWLHCGKCFFAPTFLWTFSKTSNSLFSGLATLPTKSSAGLRRNFVDGWKVLVRPKYVEGGRVTSGIL